MSTEDLDAWDATLQVCLARVLDDGGDATRVLDHLASTIASTHIPTGASALRAAELLLSHLDAPSDAPALLGFVNDTLVSTYPPEPRNKVASMWLIRAATRVVDTCPVKRLCEVVGSLQDGLSVWVADQRRVLTAEEYAFDVGGFPPYVSSLALSLIMLLSRSFHCTRQLQCAYNHSAHRSTFSKLWARCWRPVSLAARTNRKPLWTPSGTTGT
jgi:hypothetical protein